MASLLRRGLEEEGYQVDTVEDGEAAVRSATSVHYDAVVLDLMLPGLDGFEVCRRLRAGGHWVPVLLLTARHGVEDRVRGLDSGADDYLTKPFSFAELAARLRALVRRSGGPRQGPLSVGPLRLDPAAHRVWFQQTELSLSATEFALLEMFMRHPGEVLSRVRILERVWDFAFDGSSNVVDQYVSYLRRKIDRRFGGQLIQTVRGSGYRLNVDPAAIASAGTERDEAR
jgi:two-component system OmpR family response regulator